MNYLILLILIVILLETTFLVQKKFRTFKPAKRKIYVDTSVLIDGRILDIVKTGFIDGDLFILKDVLLELQLLADSKESEKRNIARSGLELVSELERIININTDIIEFDSPERKVDEKLLRIAKENKGTILTLDYNLIKVAEAEKIPVLNINDLSLALKDNFVLGETAKIKIVEKGTGRGQGIGYLPDSNRMVIVKGAGSLIGQTINVEFEHLHETSTGKIIFAKIAKKS